MTTIRFLIPFLAILLQPVLPASELWLQQDAARVRPFAAGNGGGAGLQQKVFARLLAGSGWETTLVLLNKGQATIPFRQFFFGGQGNLQSYTMQTGTDDTSLTASAIEGSLDPGASVTVVLQDHDAAALEGWTLVNFDGPQGALDGYAMLRHRSANGAFGPEAVFPLDTMQDFSTYVPFNNTQRFQTQLTLVNPVADLPANVRLTYLSSQGQVLLMDTVTLPGGGQMTIVLPNTYPDLSNKAGMIAVEADINRLAVAGLRYNALSGLMSALPVMDASAAAK